MSLLSGDVKTVFQVLETLNERLSTNISIHRRMSKLTS